MQEAEPILSLSTFQPDKCYAPYLNSPRSLEACRINGVTPADLVEISFDGFKKNGEDPDAARNRFERIDGARKIVLEKVRGDWKKLRKAGWKPEARRRTHSPDHREAILEVPPQVHCTLLEIQAAKFRKIEQDNFEELQRQLKLEIKKADQETKNKNILQKHDDIQEKQEAYQKNRLMELQQLHNEELMRRLLDEEEKMQEIKEEQRHFQEVIIKQSQEEKERIKHEKLLREQREQDRVNRDKHTQQVKDTIVHGIENKMETRRKMCELRAQNNDHRLKDHFDRKSREREEKKKEFESKIEYHRAERERKSEEARKAVLDEIAENERHRKQIEEMKEKQKAETAPLEQNLSFEKLNQIKERNHGVLKEKVRRYLIFCFFLYLMIR
jgi:DNA repair exonuclease SbcCD ATPase subunit